MLAGLLVTEVVLVDDTIDDTAGTACEVDITSVPIATDVTELVPVDKLLDTSGGRGMCSMSINRSVNWVKSEVVYN